jgi:hypothetical protein
MIQTYNASKVAGEMAEPIIPSLYEITIIPPASLVALDVQLLKEEVKSVSGFDAFERVPALISQTFGAGTRRLFPGVQVDNVVELNITMNVNLRGDDGTNATNLVTLKRMKDLQFNRASGRRGLKTEAVWSMIVSRYNKDHSIWGVATMEHCMFGESGITGLDECNIESDDAAVLNFTAISDKNKLELAATI